MTFSLVVDEFEVKYDGAKNMDHFIRSIQKYYSVSVDWTGVLYFVVSLDWY